MKKESGFPNYIQMYESVEYCLKNKISILELYRIQSEKFFELIEFTRYLITNHPEVLSESNDLDIIKETDIGKFALFNGKKIPLDLPMINEEVELNVPKRGGSKKYYVYVKNKEGNVVRVEFGQPGMKIKINDEKARKSFAARHRCHERKDKTTASYWSCNLPKYSDILGLSANAPNEFW